VGVARSKLKVSVLRELDRRLCILWPIYGLASLNLASPNPAYEPKQHVKPVVNFAKISGVFSDLSMAFAQLCAFGLGKARL
jgi:hypothetical protein